MNWLRALIARMRPEPIAFPYPSAVARPGRPTEICESEWRTALEVTRIQSYQQGLAMGELKGRRELADEIAAEFGAGVTEDDAKLIAQRQVH